LYRWGLKQVSAFLLQSYTDKETYIGRAGAEEKLIGKTETMIKVTTSLIVVTSPVSSWCKTPRKIPYTWNVYSCMSVRKGLNFRRKDLKSRTKVDLSENLTILGCTLHSHIAAEHYTSVQSRVKDFRRIKDWTVEDHNAEHRADVDWLRLQIRVRFEVARMREAISDAKSSL
jgi:hypothetical protein